MKAGIGAVCFLGATLAGALGQCEFGEPVSASGVSVETVGGITYLKFSYPTVCPQHLWRRPAVVQGTNVNQSIFLLSDFSEICTFEDPPTVYSHNATLVIGTLDPGDYLLHLDTAPPVPGWPWTTPIADVPFTVPPSQPTLSLLAANSGQIAFRVNGTTNVTYQVQSSSTLTNWVTFRTSAGGPFSVTHQPAGNQFYRARVSDGVPLCP
jgi:catechol 2,3-dioxygenase-like lactoylglutathione lyase family enzyme